MMTRTQSAAESFFMAYPAGRRCQVKKLDMVKFQTTPMSAPAIPANHQFPPCSNRSWAIPMLAKSTDRADRVERRETRHEAGAAKSLVAVGDEIVKDEVPRHRTDDSDARRNGKIETKGGHQRQRHQMDDDAGARRQRQR